MSHEVEFVTDPVAQGILTKLRDRDTPSGPVYYGFGLALSIFLLRWVVGPRPDLFPFSRGSVWTPLRETDGISHLTEKLLVVAVIRAGVVLSDAAQLVLPGVNVGLMDIHRDEKPPCAIRRGPHTILPERLDGMTVILVDCMLATGKTAAEAAREVLRRGAKKVVFIGWIGCKEGVEELQKADPEVEIFLGSRENLDPATLFLTPGAGDVGDRLFGKRNKEGDDPAFQQWLQLHLPWPGMTPDDQMVRSLRAGLAPELLAGFENLRPLVAVKAGEPPIAGHDDRGPRHSSDRFALWRSAATPLEGRPVSTAQPTASPPVAAANHADGPRDQQGVD